MTGTGSPVDVGYAEVVDRTLAAVISRWSAKGPLDPAGELQGVRATLNALSTPISGETCQSCGNPVADSTGDSWWRAPDDVWQEVYGTDAGIRCIPCFTAEAANAGVLVHWEAVRGV